ncbi:MAG: hypothetical protein QGG31_05685, partial [Anaerolineales bacterium]|nr:hypothetical protein [Anaerolineales bacterium]
MEQNIRKMSLWPPVLTCANGKASGPKILFITERQTRFLRAAFVTMTRFWSGSLLFLDHLVNCPVADSRSQSARLQFS